MNPEEAKMVQLILKNMLWETGLPIHWNNFYGNVDTEIIKGKIDSHVIANIIRNPKYKGYYVRWKVK